MEYLLLIASVLIAYLVVILFKPIIDKKQKLLLAFSGSFLLSITVLEMIPEVFSNNSKTIGLLVMVGILLQISLEFLSRGAEHGHMHIDKEKKTFSLALIIGLTIHALLEGIPVHHHDHLVYGIMVHKLPIAIILTSFTIKSGFSKGYTFIFLLLFSLMTPLGSYLGEHVSFFRDYLAEISAVVIGIFLHISTTILFESSAGHKFNLAKIITIILGISVAYLIL
ncbi:ZIP family metal transporter [Spongiivirga citrea]|uniref:ZIP family metal transporter n=1 Tax=Spongiivirga citrea TaxID=1481457 RepID=A0A6M0CH71_9FLAO|nr:ZIP family metal transporter [Spongiivirga citrea]NER16313.1 ZIP family metal transporter [Spongiivirga citrea]